MAHSRTVKLILTFLLALICQPSAEAGWITYTINGGRERPNGVPNYKQADFSPGGDDCGPVSMAMIIGYWDVNGWPRLMQRDNPFIDKKLPAAAVDNAVERFKSELPYRKPGPGTPHYAGLGEWKSPAAEAIQSMDSSTSNWVFHDDFWVSYHDDIVAEVKQNRPVQFQYWGVDLYGTLLRWGSRTGPTRSSGFLAHHMPAMGFEYQDNFWFPEEWMVFRSGWRNGGDSRIYMKFDGAIKSAFKIRPGGTAAADWNKGYLFSGSVYSRLNRETDRLDNYSGGLTHTIPWGWTNDLPASFHSNIDAAVNAGPWGKVYFFKGDEYVRFDIVKDTMDPGYPKRISQGWSLDPHFHSDIDAAVLLNNYIYLTKGTKIQAVNLVTGQTGPVDMAPVGNLDAAMNMGDNDIAYFRGGQIVGIWHDGLEKWLPGFPKNNASAIPGLFSNVDAACSLAHPMAKSGTVVRDEEMRYSLSVHENHSTVTVTMRGTGDADLYTNLHIDDSGVGGEATTNRWKCRPYLSTTNEVCTLTGVTKGAQVHITVRGYASSSNYLVGATVAPAGMP